MKQSYSIALSISVLLFKIGCMKKSYYLFFDALVYTKDTSSNSGAAITTIGRSVNHTRYMFPCSLIHLKLALLSNSITIECKYYRKILASNSCFNQNKTVIAAEYITIMLNIQLKDVS